MDNLLLLSPSKTIHFCYTRGLIKSIRQEQTEDIPKEMPTFQDRTAVYGQYHIYKEQKSVCETIDKKAAGYSKIKVSHNNQRL